MPTTRPAPSLSPSLFVALSLLASGCQVHALYLVDRGALISLSTSSPEERQHTLVPAIHEKTGAPVYLRASSIPPMSLTATEASPNPIRIRTGVTSKMVTAGVVLTLVGSVLSVVGTSVYLATRNTGHDTLANTFGIIELTSEPQMLVGTVLWIYGLTRAPQEARRDEPGVHLLAPVGAAPTAALLRW